MAGIVGDTGGKSRSSSGPTALAQQTFKRFQGQIGNEWMSQLAQILRTGGIGAQTPIVAQSVGSAQSALSQALQGQTGDLARAGLARTPYGTQQLAGTRLAGVQQIAQIPTQYAQQQLGQIPGFYNSVLGAIAQSQNQRSGPYAT